MTSSTVGMSKSPRSENDGEALFSMDMERLAVVRQAHRLAKRDLSRVTELA